MCTLSVVRTGELCTVTMNRDDLVDRPEAPPRQFEGNGLSYCAPQDLLSGGTWIGLNTAGVLACLLNRYDTPPPAHVRSRGEIVPEALQAKSALEAAHYVSVMDHTHYAPFTCVIITQDDQIRLDWTGNEFKIETVPSQPAWMITSSSVEAQDVSARRAALFAQKLRTRGALGEAITQFHSLSAPDDAWWSPWMARATAHTKSITQVTLQGEGSKMHYWDRKSIENDGLNAASSI